MLRSTLWLLAVLVPLAIDCAACGLAILGKDDPQGITQTCNDGSTCPAWALCPTAPGGRCEAPDQPPVMYGPQRLGARKVDAGP